jgi:hypothetical protein
MLRTSPISTEKAPAFATSSDFRRLFVEDSGNMYLLSFLLTADGTKADQCFVSGLENCSKENGVFRDWACSWARRTIIRTAISMLQPRGNHAPAAVTPRSRLNCEFAQSPEAKGAIGRILALEDFERFVFVMSVLESLSDQDCCLLLDCSRQEVHEARERAIQQVAGTYSPRTLAGSGADSNNHEEGRTRESHAAPVLASGFVAGLQGVTGKASWH